MDIICFPFERVIEINEMDFADILYAQYTQEQNSPT